METILIVLIVLWLLGYKFNLGGEFIHVLLVVALILFILRLI